LRFAAEPCAEFAPFAADVGNLHSLQIVRHAVAKDDNALHFMAGAAG
jgi:hypothetical protein